VLELLAALCHPPLAAQTLANGPKLCIFDCSGSAFSNNITFTLNSTYAFCSGGRGNTFKAVHFNQTPGLDEQNFNPAIPIYGQFLCQETNTLIDASANFTMDAIGWLQGDSPFVISYVGGRTSRCHFMSNGSGDNAPQPMPLNPVQYIQVGNTSFYSKVQGVCDWDSPVYGANQTTLGRAGFQSEQLVNGMHQIAAGGEYGYFPKPWTTPVIPSSVFTTLQSITGSNHIGTYPLVYGNVLYAINDVSGNAGATPSPAKLVQSNHLFRTALVPDLATLTTSVWLP